MKMNKTSNLLMMILFTFVLVAEKIRDAPVFSEEDLTDRKWAEDNYRLFGQQPYWIEGGIEKEKDPTGGRPMKEEKEIPMGYPWP